jgi:hypothetical protein
MRVSNYFVNFFYSVEVNDGRGFGGGGVGRGTESYDREKVWLSINHSILSGIDQKCRRLKADISCGEEEGTSCVLLHVSEV